MPQSNSTSRSSGATYAPPESQAPSAGTAPDAAQALGQATDPALTLATLYDAWSQYVQLLAHPLRSCWRAVFGASVLGGAIAFAGSFLVQPKFQSTIAFSVEGAGGISLPTGLAALGQQLGIGGGAGDDQPLDFYAWLARSDAVLVPVLTDTVPSRVRLARVDRRYGAAAWSQLRWEEIPTDSIRFAKGLEAIRQEIGTRVEMNTRTIHLTVRAPSRALATWMAERVVGKINELNIARRRGRAATELRFLTDRVRDAATALTDAEDELTAFHRTNRVYTDAPALRAQLERLTRQVDMARDVFLALSRASQEAELRAVRDVPTLTVVNGPTYPARRSHPRRLLVAFLASMLVFAVAYAHGWHRAARAASARV